MPKDLNRCTYATLPILGLLILFPVPDQRASAIGPTRERALVAAGSPRMLIARRTSTLPATLTTKPMPPFNCSGTAAGIDIAVSKFTDWLLALPETSLVPSALAATERKLRLTQLGKNWVALAVANPLGPIPAIRLPSDHPVAEAVRTGASLTKDALLSCLSQVAAQRWKALTPVFAGTTVVLAFLTPRSANTGAGFEFCDVNQRTQDNADLARFVVSLMMRSTVQEFQQYLKRPGCAEGMYYYVHNFAT